MLIQTTDDIKRLALTLMNTTTDYVDDPSVFINALGLNESRATGGDINEKILPALIDDFLVKNDRSAVAEDVDDRLVTGLEIGLGLAILIILQTKIKVKRHENGTFYVEIEKGAINLETLLTLLPYIGMG